MNKKALGLAGLGAVALVGGSLAYFSQTSTLENPFTTGHYNTDLHEDYTPPIDDLYPGAKWNKDVGATNTGDYPVLVRISMKETWTKKGEQKAYKTFSSAEKTNDTAEKRKAITAPNGKMDGDKFIAKQGDDADGKVDNDTESIVYKELKVVKNQDVPGWYFNEDDGYWYWNRVLMPSGQDGDATDLLMDSLILADNLDLGKYVTTEQYQIQKVDTEGETLDTLKPDSTQWKKLEKVEAKDNVEAYYKVYTDDTTFITVVDREMTPEQETTENKKGGNNDGQLDIIDIAKALGVKAKTEKIFWQSESDMEEGAEGYADSNYTLGITAEFVQATPEAVSDSWEEWKDKDIKTLLTKIYEDTDASGNKTYSNTDPNAVAP